MVNAQVELRVRLRVLVARRGVAEERVGALQRVELEEAVVARGAVDGAVAVVGERQEVRAEELPAVEEGEAASDRCARLRAVERRSAATEAGLGEAVEDAGSDFRGDADFALHFDRAGRRVNLGRARFVVRDEYDAEDPHPGGFSQCARSAEAAGTPLIESLRL